MAELPLSNGGVALVDDDAPPIVFRLKWCRVNKHYAKARLSKKYGGHGGVVYLHHLILGHPDKGHVIDHINGDGLDNRSENLQLATHARNIMRSPKKRGGVTKLHKGDRWRVRLRVDGKMASLGCFDTKEEAERHLEVARRIVWNDPEINDLGTKL